MQVTGHYMAHRVHRSTLPYVKAYGKYVLEDVLPIFKNLSERASTVTDAEFEQLGAQPATKECGDDMSCLVEAAQFKGQVFYNTMLAIRQTSLNLFAAGLFHLLEQQLAELCRDGAFEASPPSDTKLCVVACWYLRYFKLDLKKLSA